jgi:hypothetical protein
MPLYLVHWCTRLCSRPCSPWRRGLVCSLSDARLVISASRCLWVSFVSRSYRLPSSVSHCQAVMGRQSHCASSFRSYQISVCPVSSFCSAAVKVIFLSSISCRQCSESMSARVHVLVFSFALCPCRDPVHCRSSCAAAGPLSGSSSAVHACDRMRDSGDRSACGQQRS